MPDNLLQPCLVSFSFWSQSPATSVVQESYAMLFFCEAPEMSFIIMGVTEFSFLGEMVFVFWGFFF